MSTTTRFRLLLMIVLAALMSLGALCNNPPKKPAILINSPTTGTFTEDATTIVSGQILNVAFLDGVVTVNGLVVAPELDGSWTATVLLNPNRVFTPVLAELNVLSTGAVRRDRIVLGHGTSVADGDFSDDSIALRLNDSGLDQIEPLVETLTAGALDIQAFLIAANPVATTFVCVIPNPFGGCLTGFDVTVDVETASFDSFALDVDSMTNFAAGDIAVTNIDVTYDTDGIDCQGRITSPTTNIVGDYTLDPDSVDPSNIDVNLVSAIGVSFSGFNNQFTGGICDFPIIGDIIQLIIGNVQPLVTSGLVNALSDPDGSGPLDSPIADGIEVALADISISGPIGQSLGVNLESPLFDVIEDVDGITLGSDGRIQANFGTGIGQCDPPPGSPSLDESFSVLEAFPSFGPNTPVGALPYDLGICISTAAFNQLLKAEVECGLLQAELTEVDLGGGPIQLTAGFIALLIPRFSGFNVNTPMTVRITPTTAPVLTGQAGPQGELSELEIGGLDISLIVRPGQPNELLGLRARVDFIAGLNFAFTAGELVPTLASVSSANLTIALVENPVFANVAGVESVLEIVLPEVLPSLGDSLGAFPIPGFLGIQLDSVEVSRNGEFLSIFADLNPAP